MKKILFSFLFLGIFSFNLQAKKIPIKGTWTLGDCVYTVNGWVDVNFLTQEVKCYNINVSSNNPKCGSGNFSIPC